MHKFKERNKKREIGILLVLGTLIALGPFSIDMYLPAFESIAQDFSISKSDVGFSLTSYFIGIALGQLLYGPIMDKFGRKTPLLVGIVLYIIASIACFYSPNLWWLVAARFFQAIGASAGMVASKAVVRDVFPPEEVSRALSFLMLIMGGAPIIAPTVGSFLVTYYSWQVIFISLAGLATLMFISVINFLPESIIPDKSVNLRTPKVIKNYVGILKNKIFLFFSFAGSLTVGAMFGYISSAPIIFMDIYDLSETEFGWLFGMNAAGLIFGSQLNRFVLKRYSTFRTTYSIAYILVGLAILFLLNSLWSGNFYITIILLFGMLFLLGFQNPNTTALSLYPFTRRAGRASALIGSMKMLFGAITSYLISEFTNISLVPLALTFLISLGLSLGFLIWFRTKEKRSVVFIGR